ncbi:tetratricopeptide repeat protein [Saccharicrinis sp. FJH2]|uniref:tetratricopeptide repeat protein n=1 Tax=Saccharicrinis sp. FJH65 TaxID=3344659 RepID=UPI0035F2EB9F
MKNFIFISACLIIISTCKGKEKNETKDVKILKTNKELTFDVDTSISDANKLNTIAVKLLRKSESKFIDKNEKDSTLRLSIFILNKAIKNDSNFYIAYINKAKALRNIGAINESILVLKKLIKRESYAQGLLFLGLIYEKAGDMDMANDYYTKALEAYDIKFKSFEGTTMDEINREYVLLLLEGKEKSLKRINEQLKENPDDQDLIFKKSIIDGFNREEFIANF